MLFLSLEPMLKTDDMARTREWYASVLGFAVAAESGEEWCRLTRDGVSIMFMRNEHLGKPHATATHYFEVDNVMELWASIQDRCTAEWGPEEMPYGMLEFAIRDPNGYLLSFGQEIEVA
jgi:catechol 2,3-dioxygenase-like lactoylglutathione lyase family enzyme